MFNLPLSCVVIFLEDFISQHRIIFTPLLTKVVLLFISNLMRRQAHVKYLGGGGESCIQVIRGNICGKNQLGDLSLIGWIILERKR